MNSTRTSAPARANAATSVATKAPYAGSSGVGYMFVTARTRRRATVRAPPLTCGPGHSFFGADAAIPRSTNRHRPPRLYDLSRRPACQARGARGEHRRVGGGGGAPRRRRSAASARRSRGGAAPRRDGHPRPRPEVAPPAPRVPAPIRGVRVALPLPAGPPPAAGAREARARPYAARLPRLGGDAGAAPRREADLRHARDLPRIRPVPVLGRPGAARVHPRPRARAPGPLAGRPHHRRQSADR